MLDIIRTAKGLEPHVIYPDGTYMLLSDLALVNAAGRSALDALPNTVTRIEYEPGQRLAYITAEGQDGPDFPFEGTWNLGDLLLSKQVEDMTALAVLREADPSMTLLPLPDGAVAALPDRKTPLTNALDGYLAAKPGEEQVWLKPIVQALRSFLGAVLLVLCTASVWAMEHFSNVAQDQNGRAIVSATITVYQQGTTTLAAIYSDNGVTPKTNPFTTAIDGVYDFYAADGLYDIRITKQGFTSIYWDPNKTKGLALFDPTQFIVPYGDIFPSTPNSGSFWVLTSDNGTCTAGSGGNTTLCRWSGLAWVPIGGGGSGGSGGWPTINTGPITWANSLTNAACIGDGSLATCHYTDSVLGQVIRPKPDSNTRSYIWTDFTYCMFSVEHNSCMWIVDPDAATTNAIYQFQAPFKPIASLYPPLSPRGAATMTETNIVSNQPKGFWGQTSDVDTDGFDFVIPITAKMVGATTVTVRLWGVSTNASPSGNIKFTCALKAYRPGTDTYGAHDTTGEQGVTLTPATQSRPVSAVSSAITINGTVAEGGELIGSCETDSAGTTSAQMGNFYLRGNALIQLGVNSWSD